MRLIYIFLILLITTAAYNQVSYNPVDTTYTFNYNQLQLIKNKIEGCKAERSSLEREITLLEDLNSTKDIKIKKLEVRDSLYQKELDLYKEMDKVMSEKAYKANDIINNQKLLILTAEDQLKAETKKARKQELWKNVYKYSYPIIGIIVAGIIVTK